RAAAALRRRHLRRPWAPARNAEIALAIELGDLARAAEAAWEESCLHQPGCDESSYYALLAAALWGQLGSEPSLDDRVQQAVQRSEVPRPTTEQAVAYALA